MTITYNSEMNPVRRRAGTTVLVSLCHMAFRAAVLILITGAAAAKDVPLPEGWIRTPPKMDQETLRCANLFDDEWRVRSVNGRLSISRHESRAIRIPPELKKRLEALPRDQSGTSFTGFPRPGAILRVDRGWLVGFDYGEWGGSLWWVPEKGRPKRLYGENTEFLFRWGGTLHAAGGLAHLLLDSGFVLELRKGDEGWEVSKEIKTPSDVEAIEILDKKRLLVIGNDSPSIVFRDGRVVSSGFIRPTMWSGLYPNSVAKVGNDRFAVGMRYAVAELSLRKDLLRQTSWLVLKKCARLKLVPDGKHVDQCRCVPASE